MIFEKNYVDSKFEERLVEIFVPSAETSSFFKKWFSFYFESCFSIDHISVLACSIPSFSVLFICVLINYNSFSLHLKEEARSFLEEHTIKDLVKKYSQFINFNIYLWTSKTETVEEPIEEEAEPEKKDEEKADEKKKDDEKKDDEKKDDEKKDDEEAEVEEAEEDKDKEKKPKTKKVCWPGSCSSIVS